MSEQQKVQVEVRELASVCGHEGWFLAGVEDDTQTIQVQSGLAMDIVLQFVTKYLAKYEYASTALEIVNYNMDVEAVQSRFRINTDSRQNMIRSIIYLLLACGGRVLVISYDATVDAYVLFINFVVDNSVLPTGILNFDGNAFSEVLAS